MRELAVGAELRRVRLEKKLSLRSVATAVSVSASLLSQVETGKTQPSVSTLYALVSHLGVSLDGIMSGTSATFGPSSKGPSTNSVVQRGADNPTIDMENGVTWERLAHGSSGLADPLLVTYPPGSSSSLEGKLMRHEAAEYGYLLQGTLILKYEFETIEIHAGDSFSFDANRPHLYRNESNETVKGLWFVIGTHDAQYDQPLTRLADGHSAASAVDVLRMINEGKEVRI
jgi:transcriptional regulator with XRE-family HTH domain